MTNYSFLANFLFVMIKSLWGGSELPYLHIKKIKFTKIYFYVCNDIFFKKNP